MLGRRRNSSSLCGGEAEGSWTQTLLGGWIFQSTRTGIAFLSPQASVALGNSPKTCALGLSVVFVCLKKACEEKARE